MLNRLKFTFFLTIAIAFNLTTYGQQQWGVKINGGVSKIAISSEIFDMPFSTHFVPSGQAGLYYNLSLGKQSTFGTELLFSQIEGKDIFERYFIDMEGNNFGHATNIGYRHISYVSLPVYFGYTIKKFTLNAGFQLSYALSSSGREKSYGTYNEGGQEISDSNDTKIDNINIKKVDFGPRAGIAYPLTQRLAVEATYYYGMNNIQKGDPAHWELKVQQLTFGIRYALCTKESTK